MIGKIKILIVEHDPNDIELIQYELKKGGINYISEILQTEDEYRNALKNFIPDIILSDYSIPSFSGLAAFEIKNGISPHTPFIFVSGTIGEENSIELIKNGVTDFTLKDKLFTLPLKVKRAVEEAKAELQKIKAEKALRQLEEKYRSIFTNILEGIFQVLPDGRYTTVNPAFVDMLGYQSPSEFIATITDIDHLYVQPERYNKLKQLLDERGVVQGFEIQMYRKNGSIIWISLNARAIYDDHGTLLYHEGTAQDITKQKKTRDAVKPTTLLSRILGIFLVAEVLVMFILSLIDMPHGIWEYLTDAVLLTIFCAPLVYWLVVRNLTQYLVNEVSVAQAEAQTNEHRYQNLINTAPDIVYTLAGGDNIITLLNPAFETVTGWSQNEWIGKAFNTLVHPDDLKLATETFQQILKGKNPPPYELRILTKSGTYLVGEFTNVPQFELGKIVGVLGIARDITERKRTEEALRITQFAFDNAGDSIQFIEPDSRIVNVNEAACLMLGYTRQELLELSVPDIDPNYNEEVWSMFFPELREKGSLFFETLQQAKDGRLIPVEIRANYINFGDKEFSCAFVRDITERKKAKVELIKAKEKAEESDRLKSAFLANMSHEIRTPMNGILGFADLLNEPNLTGKQQQEYIKIIERSGVRMLNIINDIIDISKIEAGLTKVNLKSSNINEQIEYIYTFFKPEVEQKGMQLFFKKSLASKDAVIKTDREKIYAILTNLVKNAIKYTNEGFIELGCRLNTDSKPAELEFFVKDTGIGVPKDRQEAIFERFIQADISSKMAYQGAGLGLSISKAYVELLGGKIWVESEEGNLPAGKAGRSIFYFTIPYHTESEEKNLVENLVPDNEANDYAKNLNILIVDDDKISRMLLTKTIKVFSKEIIEAMDGVEALEACKNNPDIDLVMMDINMPNMNGHEATRQIRQFNKNVIIIAQTANAFDSDRKLAMESGCNDFISKPIRKNELLGLINKYFNKEIIN
ncbi:PAS domain S-box protein [Algoriphagus aquimarinus]|uniref:PAS domain S-box protein n=1 Tax=Algoriphagus aquimarinus TaxID=237018 RepID=UPI0030DB7117